MPDPDVAALKFKLKLKFSFAAWQHVAERHLSNLNRQSLHRPIPGQRFVSRSRYCVWILLPAHTVRFTPHQFSSTKKLKTFMRACIKERKKLNGSSLELREGEKKINFDSILLFPKNSKIIPRLKSWISTTSPHNITTVIVGGNPLLVERIDFRHQVAHQQTLSCPAGKKHSHRAAVATCGCQSQFSMAEIKMWIHWFCSGR